MFVRFESMSGSSYFVEAINTSDFTGKTALPHAAANGDV
jgi:hypothetical protein